ncbi:uncharacterized protein [Neodiprion pinetum]|uniref:uncharacterized protein n=1 Tax=Neodiprion pinetum TaxID=441929 RepID=UPI001EDF93AD|nr:uncharacterized protein LOC124224752 [Neodiprion pinetum]
MFSIDCEKDNLYCKVDDFEVKFDEENIPTPGELVNFYWKSKEFQGKVIIYSKDENAIALKFEELTKKNEKSKRRKSGGVIVTPKSSGSRKWRGTPENKNVSDASDNKKPKKSASNKVINNSTDPDQTSQNYIQQFLNEKTTKRKLSKIENTTSPTKEDLKEKLQQVQAQLDAVQDKIRAEKERTPCTRGKIEGEKRDSSPITESPNDSDSSSVGSTAGSVKSRSNERKTLDVSPPKFSIHEEVDYYDLINQEETDENENKRKENKNQSDEDNDKSAPDDKPDDPGELLATSEGDSKDKAPLNDPTFHDEDVQLLGPNHNMKVLYILAIEIIKK